MKIILAAMCILVIVFSGGCAVVSMVFGTAAFFLIPTLIGIVLNVMILRGLFGAKQPWKPAFYILAVLDFAVAASGVFFLPGLIGSGGGLDPTTTLVVALFAGGFLLKGGLTLSFARELQSAA